MQPEIDLTHNPNSFHSEFNDNFRSWCIEHLAEVTGIDPHEFPPLTDQELWEALKTIGSNQPYTFDESRLTLGQSLAVALGILLDTPTLPTGDCIQSMLNNLPEEHGFTLPWESGNQFLGGIAMAFGVALGFDPLREYCPDPLSDEELVGAIADSKERLESLSSM